MINRQTFIRTYALALLHFGAASHRITEQLTSAALILNVPAGFTQLPNIVIVAFGDKETHSTETHVIKSAGKLQLGRLDQVQEIYNRVKADEYSAKFATRDLKHLIAQHPIYTIPQRCFCSFWLAVLICPLSFGGSFVDCWLAGVGAFLLCLVQLTLSSWKPTLANVFEYVVCRKVPDLVSDSIFSKDIGSDVDVIRRPSSKYLSTGRVLLYSQFVISRDWHASGLFDSYAVPYILFFVKRL